MAGKDRQDEGNGGHPLSEAFARIANFTSHAAGRASTFVIAAGVVAVWAVTGPLFHFSDTWQLVINTGTTIVTFLMVFLIQNSQNRDTEAIQLKLDELIRATRGAHNALLDLEELEERELDVFRARYVALARIARERSDEEADRGTPEVIDPR